MTTTQPAQPSAAHPEAGWSLDLPDTDSADSAENEDSQPDTGQPESPPEGEENIELELDPDRGERNGLKESQDAVQTGSSDSIT